MIVVHLKDGREKPVRAGHPWIFGGAISRVEGIGESGDPCLVMSYKGELLGSGYYNPKSAISVRMVSKDSDGLSREEVDARIKRAIRLREPILNEETNCCRLVNSEGDFLPGLIVDKYGDGLVIQVLTAGIERIRGLVVESLKKLLNPTFMYERSDTEARKREGLQGQQGIVHGSMPTSIVLKEQSLQFKVDIASGQKTGFFFDQRENRSLVRKYAYGKTVCDCFAYSGGFTTYALAGGARKVDTVDISKVALKWAEENISGNNFEGEKVNLIGADVFKFLREDGQKYDLIVLDPPKFAKHPGEVMRASRGYKDINLLAIKRCVSEGLLFTFSCSNAIDTRLFRQIVFAAAADANRPVQLVHILAAGPDHPVNIAHREGEYLKGLVLRVL